MSFGAFLPLALAEPQQVSGGTLAVSANAVALVGGLAALAVAIVSPISAWVMARSGQEHERRVAHAERIFTLRADAYRGIVRDVRKDIGSFHDVLLWLEYPKEYDEPDESVLGDRSEWTAIEANVAVFGSESVIDAFDALSKTMVAVISGLDKDIANGTLDLEVRKRALDTARGKMHKMEAAIRADIARFAERPS